MDLRRLSLAQRFAAAGAIALFGLMFVDWFGIKATGGGAGEGATGPTETIDVDVQDSGVSAWDALDIVPLLLMVAIFAVLLSAIVAANRDPVNTPVSLNLLATAFSALGLATILYRVVSPPDFGTVLRISVEGTPRLGIYLGLVAAAVMTAGSWQAMAEEEPSGPPPA